MFRFLGGLSLFFVLFRIMESSGRGSAIAVFIPIIFAVIFPFLVYFLILKNGISNFFDAGKFLYKTIFYSYRKNMEIDDVCIFMNDLCFEENGYRKWSLFFRENSCQYHFFLKGNELYSVNGDKKMIFLERRFFWNEFSIMIYSFIISLSIDYLFKFSSGNAIFYFVIIFNIGMALKMGMERRSQFPDSLEYKKFSSMMNSLSKSLFSSNTIKWNKGRGILSWVKRIFFLRRAKLVCIVNKSAMDILEKRMDELGVQKDSFLFLNKEGENKRSDVVFVFSSKSRKLKLKDYGY